VVRGFFAYHAVLTNYAALGDFRAQVVWLWRRSLWRRSQTDDTLWTRMARLAWPTITSRTGAVRCAASRRGIFVTAQVGDGERRPGQPRAQHGR
jgi:hypothetical protein